MGGDLSAAPEGRAPTFLVRAVKDPVGANLDQHSCDPYDLARLERRPLLEAGRADARAELNLAVVQVEPLDGVPEAAIAAAAGTTVMLNPAPARPLGDSLLSDVDVLTPNEGESAFLTGEAESAAAATRLRATRPPGQG